MIKPPMRFASERTIKILTVADNVWHVAMYGLGLVLLVAGVVKHDAVYVTTGAFLVLGTQLDEIQDDLKRQRTQGKPPTVHISTPDLTAEDAAKLRAKIQDVLRKDQDTDVWATSLEVANGRRHG